MQPSDGLSQRLSHYRRIAGLSARELADRAGRGLTRGVIANIESGRKKDVTVDQLLALAATLGIPPMALALPFNAPFRHVELTDGTRRVVAPVWVASEWFRDDKWSGVMKHTSAGTPASSVVITTIEMVREYVNVVRRYVNRRGAGTDPATVEAEYREIQARAAELATTGADVTIESFTGGIVDVAQAETVSFSDVGHTWMVGKVEESEQDEHPTEA